MTLMEKKLQSGLNPIMLTLGFLSTETLCFLREKGDRIDIACFAGRQEQLLYKFSFTVGVRFPEIESMIRPDNNDPTYPTIAAPIHFLHSGRQFFEWEFSDDDDLAEVIESVKVYIERWGEAFFAHYSSFSAVEHDLQSGPSGADWHMLNRLQVVETLIALAKLDGRVQEALDILEKALSDPKNRKPAPRRRLEFLRSRL